MTASGAGPIGFPWLAGRACTGVRRLGSGGFGFEFGDAVLRVAGAWRILGRDEVLFGQRDGDRLFGEGTALDAATVAATLLVGPWVIDASADAGTGDLEIAFSSGHRLEVWTDGAGHEPWSLSQPAAGRWAAQPGGRVMAEAPPGGQAPA